MEMILERGATGLQGDTVLQTNAAPSACSAATVRPAATDNQAGTVLAGDFAAYRRHCAFLDVSPALPFDETIRARRAHALAYLGERAQLHGGVFRASRPTVFTEAVVAGMAKRNAVARFSRYPWLAEMLALMAALDTAQHGATNRDGNVLLFPDGYNSRA